MRLPLWSPAVLALLFVPAVLAHEPVFGDGVGLRAAGAGVLVGLGIATVAARLRWDLLTTAVVGVAGYLLLGGVAALPDTTIAGFVPSGRTLQLLVTQSVSSWKDLLTLAPPASAYTGPAVLPWLSGLVCGLAAGVLTVRGRFLLGTLPVALLGAIGVAWGLGGQHPDGWPVAGWAAGVLGWWAWCNQRRRLGAGEEILVGRRAVGRVVAEDSLSASLTATGNRRVAVVYTGRRVLAALATLGLAVGVAGPALGAWRAFDDRVVLRDLVEPPLDVREYPSPLASFRHYTVDLARTTLVTVTGLPAGARLRLGVMDTYNGIAFGMSDPAESETGRYVRTGAVIREQAYAGAGEAATVEVTASGLSGPWLPSAGEPDTWRFTGDNAAALAEGMHVNHWAQAALTTAPTGGNVAYQLHTVVPPTWSDGQLEGAGTGRIAGSADAGVPDGVQALAQDITAGQSSQLGRARAIERYLSRKGYFANDNSANARPGHRADRLARMIGLEQLIGDDEQYASLMALMLHSLGMPARVVMGLYPAEASGTDTVELRGEDMHAWVEVQFSGVGWATFDPTPPRDQVPQTDVQKPRAVPRPQVLQPPEPPEAPVELPPSVSDRPADEHSDDADGVPWLLVGGAGGGVLLLLAPFAAIWWAKRARARRRRRAAVPAAAVTGAWSELVDRAVDAGAAVPAELTRLEAAGTLAALWPGETPAPDRGWYVEGAEVPRVVRLARRADVASFAPAAPDAAEATAAWADTDELTAGLAAGAGFWSRQRRRYSLRSLRRRRRLARAARRKGRRP